MYNINKRVCFLSPYVSEILGLFAFQTCFQSNAFINQDFKLQCNFTGFTHPNMSEVFHFETYSVLLYLLNLCSLLIKKKKTILEGENLIAFILEMALCMNASCRFYRFLWTKCSNFFFSLPHLSSFLFAQIYCSNTESHRQDNKTAILNIQCVMFPL